jgi:hypothetical protein
LETIAKAWQDTSVVSGTYSSSDEDENPVQPAQSTQRSVNRGRDITHRIEWQSNSPPVRKNDTNVGVAGLDSFFIPGNPQNDREQPKSAGRADASVERLAKASPDCQKNSRAVPRLHLHSWHWGRV